MGVISMPVALKAVRPVLLGEWRDRYQRLTPVTPALRDQEGEEEPAKETRRVKKIPRATLLKG